jgi:LmbE family N-acetylglucosaminyl deacetylase
MSAETDARERFDVVAVGAHPDDVEIFMGGTISTLAARGLRVLIVDLCDGEPTRYAPPGARREQAARAAELLGASRTILDFHDRLLEDSPSTRMAVAALIRQHRPRFVFTSDGSGVHPDHKAVTDIVTHAVFYARLPKWDQVPGGEVLADSDPHEIDRLFYGHCRMERPWREFDFAVDVTGVYQRKTAAIDVYQSVFCGPQAARLERFRIEDQYVGSLVGVEYAEAFKARSPLLVVDPTAFVKTPFG